jgi:hypothetical protein
MLQVLFALEDFMSVKACPNNCFFYIQELCFIFTMTFLGIHFQSCIFFSLIIQTTIICQTLLLMMKHGEIQGFHAAQETAWQKLRLLAAATAAAAAAATAAASPIAAVTR